MIKQDEDVDDVLGKIYNNIFFISFSLSLLYSKTARLIKIPRVCILLYIYNILKSVADKTFKDRSQITEYSILKTMTDEKGFEVKLVKVRINYLAYN